MTNVPAVSVIIPMYNSEKYIGECLESILIQTLQNFEVIVVDDCSTDSSRAVVEKYIPKFGGRLKLTSMEKNSGKPSLPRNKGVILSRGEYILFVDNDDSITPTALEELYTLAKKYAAEVVYCEHYYAADMDLKNIRRTQKQNGSFPCVKKPTFETPSFHERVDRVIQYMFVAMPWNYMVKRKLLIENDIIFPDIIRDDSIWTWHVVFCAKKILRVPNTIYIWRENKTSITRVEKTPSQKVIFWIQPIILGTRTLNETMTRIEFFQKNFQCLYDILKYFVYGSFEQIIKSGINLDPSVFYEAVQKEFSKNLGKQDVLIPFLCSFIYEQQRIINKK